MSTVCQLVRVFFSFIDIAIVLTNQLVRYIIYTGICKREDKDMDLRFYRGKRILVTGHTGFKGSWLCRVLKMNGAEITGYSLPPIQPSLFELADIGAGMKSISGDIRDFSGIIDTINDFRPEIVIHMAAQPIVNEGYNRPAYTYETNVMGTVNICEAIRLCGSVRSFVNVTTDKVYRNNSTKGACSEEDMLDGYDPYSNSKSCSELVTACYARSFLRGKGTAVSTCRAGNVIGGGDFAEYRIIPDCIRALEHGDVIRVYHPDSVRPYQHVLEPVIFYLMLAAAQYDRPEVAGCYNIGPPEHGHVKTRSLVDMVCRAWGNGAAWENTADANQYYEEKILKIDCSRANSVLGWKPSWNITKAIEKTVQLSKAMIYEKDSLTINRIMEEQICEYLDDMDPMSFSAENTN